MSDTLRFLNKTSGSQEDAAQDFLNKKMADNKFNVSTPGDPYSLGEGVVPTGPAYDADNPTKNQKPASGGGGNGRLSSEEMRERFGLQYNEEHASGSKTHPNGSNEQTGALYNRETGEYIGTVANKETAGADYQNIREFAKSSGLLQQDVGDYDTLNDVASLASQVHGAGKGGDPVAEKPNTPIEHSPEIRQAKQIVKNYDIGVRSGSTSKDLYGDYSDIEVDSSIGKEFEANKGINGIGTQGGVSSDNSAAKASANFLEAKKTDVKKKYQFQPAS